MIARLTFLLLLPWVATGCADSPTCPAWAYPAVQVSLKSAATGSPILGARGEVRDGRYRDSLVDHLDGKYSAAANRAGTYAVHLEREGFAPWDTSGVFVEPVGGACPTVDTERLNARVQPAP
jgi:hypothetical protein